MTEELYEYIETDTAFEALKALARDLPDPLVLLGGWAVYFMVNKSFSDEHGSSYLGSKDIDLGFKIDINMSLTDLKKSSFARTLENLERLGYTPIGSFRYCKFIHRSSREILTEKEAKATPIYELLYLYVDLLVDRIHPAHDQAFKIKALDEPLLAKAFDKNLLRRISIDGSELFIPNPDLLLGISKDISPNRYESCCEPVRGKS